MVLWSLEDKGTSIDPSGANGGGGQSLNIYSLKTLEHLMKAQTINIQEFSGTETTSYTIHTTAITLWRTCFTWMTHKFWYVWTFKTNYCDYVRFAIHIECLSDCQLNWNQGTFPQPHDRRKVLWKGNLPWTIIILLIGGHMDHAAWCATHGGSFVNKRYFHVLDLFPKATLWPSAVFGSAWPVLTLISVESYSEWFSSWLSSSLVLESGEDYFALSSLIRKVIEGGASRQDKKERRHRRAQLFCLSSDTMVYTIWKLVAVWTQCCDVRERTSIRSRAKVDLLF